MRSACPAPLLWADGELRELQDTAFAMQQSVARQTAARGFEGFLAAWPLGAELHAALGHPSADTFVWALAMVQSRGMADELPGRSAGAPRERVAMLVPFADMANHVAGDPVRDTAAAVWRRCCLTGAADAAAACAGLFRRCRRRRR